MKLPGTFAPDGSVNVIIETPSGSRNKFAYNKEMDLFTLRKILPAGTNFPLEMGFIPGTLADDGDPLDVLVMMEYPACTGCLVACRIIGIIEITQAEKNKKPERNDRLLAVPECTHDFINIHSVKDLPKKKLDEISGFLEYYNKMEKRKFKLLGVQGPRKAMQVLKNHIQ